MVTKQVWERTTDLSAPPAPHLSPTVVRVDNPDMRRSMRKVRLVLLALLGLPLAKLLAHPLASSSGMALVFMIWLLVTGLMLGPLTRPERVRAGAGWLSVHGGRRWVELDKLTGLARTGLGKWAFYDARRRFELIEADYLRYCPILFDLLMRGVMRAEEAGTMQPPGASKMLMSSAPPGYRRPERWDSPR